MRCRASSLLLLLLLLSQLDPNGFDRGTGAFDTDEIRVFARLAEARHPVAPCLLTYGVDTSVPVTPGRSFTERVSHQNKNKKQNALLRDEIG